MTERGSTLPVEAFKMYLCVRWRVKLLVMTVVFVTAYAAHSLSLIIMYLIQNHCKEISWCLLCGFNTGFWINWCFSCYSLKTYPNSTAAMTAHCFGCIAFVCSYTKEREFFSFYVSVCLCFCLKHRNFLLKTKRVSCLTSLFSVKSNDYWSKFARLIAGHK